MSIVQAKLQQGARKDSQRGELQETQESWLISKSLSLFLTTCPIYAVIDEMDTLYEQERKRFEEESNRTESSDVSRDADSALRPLSESSSNRSSLASLELDPDDRLDLSGMTIEQRKKLRVANVFRHMLKVRHFELPYLKKPFLGQDYV